ncbi:MAG: sugar phosphate isomerase/epimerase family protein [Pseudomonadota bacterium]
MQFGVFAKTYPGKQPHGSLAAAAADGYATVQYNMACSGLASMPLEIPSNVAEEVRQASRETGVTLCGLSATYNMIHPDRAVREAGHASFRVLAAQARDMGTDLLTLCTGTRHPDDQWAWHADNATPTAWRDLRESLDVILPIAHEFDLHLGIEPELANVVNSAKAARRLLDETGSPRLRIVFDPANLFEVETIDDQRTIMSHGFDLLGDDIVIAHAKDRQADGSFTTAGNGVLDYRHFIRGLSAIGFDGPLVTHGLAAEDAGNVRRFLQRALEDAD